MVSSKFFFNIGSDIIVQYRNIRIGGGNFDAVHDIDAMSGYENLYGRGGHPFYRCLAHTSVFQNQ
jgi:hypothetical protein